MNRIGIRKIKGTHGGNHPVQVLNRYKLSPNSKVHFAKREKKDYDEDI